MSESHGGEGESVTHTEDSPALASLDLIAQRLKLYAGSIIVVGAIVGAAVSFVVVHATGSIRGEIVALQGRADRDSVRFERVMRVIEPMAIALIEPAGSAGREDAINQLRALRHVGP